MSNSTAEEYESPPTDLMIRRAFEFPWTRRKRLRAWREWTSQHWDRKPATSASAGVIISEHGERQAVKRASEEEPERGTRKVVSEAEQQATAVSERASEALAATHRATQAAQQLDDPALLVRALHAEASALRLMGDQAAAITRYTRIFGMVEDPTTRDRLLDPQAVQAATDAMENLSTYLAEGPATRGPLPDAQAAQAVADAAERFRAYFAYKSRLSGATEVRQSGQLDQPPQSSSEQTANVVEPGMTVTVRFEGDDYEVTFLLSPREESGSPIDVYSPRSPLGSAIMGKKVQETATFTLPDGSVGTVEILDAVPYLGAESSEAKRSGSN